MIAGKTRRQKRIKQTSEVKFQRSYSSVCPKIQRSMIELLVVSIRAMAPKGGGVRKRKYEAY